MAPIVGALQIDDHEPSRPCPARGGRCAGGRPPSCRTPRRGFGRTASSAGLLGRGAHFGRPCPSTPSALTTIPSGSGPESSGSTSCAAAPATTAPCQAGRHAPLWARIDGTQPNARRRAAPRSRTSSRRGRALPAPLREPLRARPLSPPPRSQGAQGARPCHRASFVGTRLPNTPCSNNHKKWKRPSIGKAPISTLVRQPTKPCLVLTQPRDANHKFGPEPRSVLAGRTPPGRLPTTPPRRFASKAVDVGARAEGESQPRERFRSEPPRLGRGLSRFLHRQRGGLLVRADSAELVVAWVSAEARRRRRLAERLTGSRGAHRRGSHSAPVVPAHLGPAPAIGARSRARRTPRSRLRGVGVRPAVVRIGRTGRLGGARRGRHGDGARTRS